MIVQAQNASVIFKKLLEKENRLFAFLLVCIVLINAGILSIRMMNDFSSPFAIPYYCSAIIILTALVASSVEDLATKMISNIFLYLGLAGSLDIAISYFYFYGDYFNLLAMAVFASLFWLIRVSFLFFRKKEIVGDGDIFIVAIMAGLLGFIGTIIAIFLAALIALPVILLSKDKEIPFVPFLTMGTFFVFYLGEQFLPVLGIFVNA